MMESWPRIRKRPHPQLREKRPVPDPTNVYSEIRLLASIQGSCRYGRPSGNRTSTLPQFMSLAPWVRVWWRITRMLSDTMAVVTISSSEISNNPYASENYKGKSRDDQPVSEVKRRDHANSPVIERQLGWLRTVPEGAPRSLAPPLSTSRCMAFRLAVQAGAPLSPKPSKCRGRLF
jgi:hypothetical protein